MVAVNPLPDISTLKEHALGNRYRVRSRDTGQVFTVVEDVSQSGAISGPRRDISTYHLDETGEFVRADGPTTFVSASTDVQFDRIAD